MPPATHDPEEHERTYAVPDGVEVPFPVGSVVVADVREVVLEARYVDTDRLDLLRRGRTLRRRTGGGDAGWHLKTPVGTDRRREAHHDLGDDGEVPTALLDQVRALVRDRPLVPVATIRTERTETDLVDADGRPLAVACDDRVHAVAVLDGARPSTWREWEVELAPGRTEDDLDALEDVVLGTGATRSDQPSKLARTVGRPDPRGRAPEPGTAGALLHARLVAQVDELHRRDAQVRAGDPEGVHRARVAARRLRSALQTCRRLLGPGSTDHVRAELRLLGRVLAPARDTQVLEERLTAALADEPVELVLGPVSARLVTELHRDRDRAAVRVQEALSSERYWRLLDALDALVDDLPLRPDRDGFASDVVPDLVRRDARRVHRAARAAHEASGDRHDEALHALRKKAKRLRYAAELSEPLGGKGSRRLRKRARELQRALGEHQDAAVARDALRRLGVAAHLAGENGFTFGVLLGTERLHAEEAEHRAVLALDRLPRPKAAARRVRG